MPSARTRPLCSLPSLLRKLAVYAAVELLGYASASLTLETARSRNLASASFYLLSKLAIQLVRETDGWKISSFRKLEIEPIGWFRRRIAQENRAYTLKTCSLRSRYGFRPSSREENRDCDTMKASH